MKIRLPAARRQSGISYPEVLAAVIVVAVAAIPATNALRGAMSTVEADSRATVNHYRLKEKMEQVLADPFAAVAAQAAGNTTASVYSDPAGSVDRRVVYIAQYDGDDADADDDPFTGTDPGLLWIRVEIEGSRGALQALKADQ